jgi:hypothetical protein
MHLLYLDESGSISDPCQRYFVLAGLSVFERSTHWIETELNAIAERFNPSDPYSIELHGSPMRTEVTVGPNIHESSASRPFWMRSLV